MTSSPAQQAPRRGTRRARTALGALAVALLVVAGVALVRTEPAGETSFAAPSSDAGAPPSPADLPADSVETADVDEPVVDEPVADGIAVDGSSQSVYVPFDGCDGADVVPLGQSPNAFNFEPLGSVWCFGLSEPPARTAVEGANSWVDDFDVGCTAAGGGCTSMMRFDDGDMGYRAFDGAGNSPGRSQHWINQNHWMVDAQEGFTGGASVRPDRSFRFEDGKIVVEGDFAAAIPEYGPDTWGEITITGASEPVQNPDKFADILYAYGQFTGDWSVGCRLHSNRTPICAVMGPEADSPPADGECHGLPGNYRVSEMSWFQQCGSSTMGGYPSGDIADAWRECVPEGPDMACRDRFRMEVTRSSITLFVNGVKYFEDAGWPAAHRLPDSFVNGDVYVYQSNWQHRAGERPFRYHWDRFAVNPPTGPTPSGTFATT